MNAHIRTASNRRTTTCNCSSSRTRVALYPLRTHRGFSLIELMIALVIASLLLIGLTALLINENSARSEIEKSSRQIENGRYAMQILSDEVRHAGYFGPLILAPTLPGTVTSLPDPCSQTLSVVQDSLGLPLQGYVGATTAANLDTGKLGCLSAVAGYKPNTAVLVVRRADTSILASAPTGGWFNIQASGCAGDTSAYVADVATNAGAFTLHTNTGAGCTPITGAPAAKISPLYTRIYFISTCSGTDCSASGADSVPTLKRIDLKPTGTLPITPIVDGIENLQFDYGIDTTVPGDGAPDVYTNTLISHPAFTPSSMTEWTNVMSVRIYLLARNVDVSNVVDVKTYALGPVSDTPGGTFRRHAYNELVRLNNPSGRRE